MPATRMLVFDAADAVTPIIKLAVDTIASSDPSTAARSHPPRSLRCVSRCGACSRSRLRERMGRGASESTLRRRSRGGRPDDEPHGSGVRLHDELRRCVGVKADRAARVEDPKGRVRRRREDRARLVDERNSHRPPCREEHPDALVPGRLREADAPRGLSAKKLTHAGSETQLPRCKLVEARYRRCRRLERHCHHAAVRVVRCRSRRQARYDPRVPRLCPARAACDDDRCRSTRSPGPHASRSLRRLRERASSRHARSGPPRPCGSSPGTRRPDR
jgi:hypothetical protein